MPIAAEARAVKLEELDKRQAELRGDIRSGFARLDNAIEGLRSEINDLRKLLVGILIAIITGMMTLAILLVITLLTLLT